MPIYEYKCKKCNKEFEKLQKFSDLPVKKCPECGGKAIRLISHSSFILKGTGWYATDYGGKSNGPSKKDSVVKESSPDASTDSSSMSETV
jgi:putative FmdB family regulatory protein